MVLVVFLAGVAASFPPLYFLVSHVLDRRARAAKVGAKGCSNAPVGAFLDHLSSEVILRIEKLMADVVTEAGQMPATCDRIGDGLSTATRVRFEELVKSVEALFGEASACKISNTISALQAAPPSSLEIVELLRRDIREALPKSSCHRQDGVRRKRSRRQVSGASLSLGVASAAST